MTNSKTAKGEALDNAIETMEMKLKESLEELANLKRQSDIYIESSLLIQHTNYWLNENYIKESKGLEAKIKELQERLDIYEKPINLDGGDSLFILNEQGALKMHGLMNKIKNLEKENSNLKAELEEFKSRITIIQLNDIIENLKDNSCI